MTDQERGAPLAEFFDGVRRRMIALFAGDGTNADQWLRTPNQHLAGRIPIDMINACKKDRRALNLLVGSMEHHIAN